LTFYISKVNNLSFYSKFPVHMKCCQVGFIMSVFWWSRQLNILGSTKTLLTPHP